MEPEILNKDTEIQAGTPNIWKSAMTYGLYFALASIALTVILYATNNMTSKANQWLGLVIMVAAVILFQLAYRKALGGYISYGQALGIAVLSVFFASIITAIFTYVLYKFIDPGLIDQIMLATEEKMVERGLPEDQLEAAMAMSSKFSSPGFISVISIFSLTFYGLIIGAISAIFTKKPDTKTIFE